MEYYFLLAGMGIVILGVILFITGLFAMEETSWGQRVYQIGLALGISGFIIIGTTIGVTA